MDWTNHSYTWRMLLSSIKECALEEYMGFYIFRYDDKCVLKVEVVGILISLEIQEKRSILVIDDGTTTIRCIKYRDISTTEYNLSSSSNLSADDIEFGDTVLIQGSLVKAEMNDSSYDFMIMAQCIEKVEDPNVEVFHWLYCIRGNSRRKDPFVI